MEFIAKLTVYVVLGIAVMAVNVWYARAVYRTVSGGDLVIAPVKIVGGPGDSSVLGDALARMVISRIQALEWDLQQSQMSLQQEGVPRTDEPRVSAPSPAPGAPRGVTAGILGTPRTAGLNAQLFEPTSIDVKVAGLDVGGLLPRVQRWFVQDRTLSFSASLRDKSAVIAGNIDALGLGKTRPFWISLDNATVENIPDEIALALIQRRWAKASPEYGELEDDEFRKLVNSIREVAKINRRVMTYNISGQAGFERILADVGPLADRMTGWSELTYFAASIAESAEAHERALAFYRRLQGGNKQQLPAETLAAKIKALETVLAKLNPNIMEDAVEKMHSAALDATKILNELFALKLDVPRIELISDEMRNAYWDGKAIHAPAAVKELPDIVYHEVAWPFIQKRWSFSYRGQEGALAQSYTDVLTSLIKQKKLGQTAQEADWTIAPGAIAWIAGNKAGMRDDRRPLVSLKAPGTAYNDELLGKDPQPAHFSKFVVVEADNGGIHINSGIPNKAFYEAAIRIGSEKAGKIWIESLTQFKTKTDIPQAAKIIHETAVRLYGKDSGEENAVQKAWNAVGLLEQRS